MDGLSTTTACNSDIQAEATENYEIWSFQDDSGNELYTISKSKEYSKNFTVGPIPITVTASATGNLGIRGDVTLDTTNTVAIVVGPYLELTGYAEGGVGAFGISAGIGIELLILEIDLPFTANLQVLPSYPLAIFTETPLIIKTMDGKVYVYAKTWWDKYTYTIVKWDGYKWEFALIDPVFMYWAEPNQFINISSSGTGSITTLDIAISSLDYNWQNGYDAFSALWAGDFNFDAGTYAFEAEADDYLEVTMDTDSDDSYDTTLFGLNDSKVIDHAGDNDGTLKNGPTWLTGDALSNAGTPGSISFDGNNDYVKVAHSDDFEISNTITVEAWINADSLEDYVATVSFLQDNSNTESGYGLRYNDGKMCFFLTTNDMGSNDWNDNPGASINTGEWVHIAGTYDGSTIRFYKNGVQTEYEDQTGDIDWSPSPTDLCIGMHKDDNTEWPFDGKVDEVRIWNTVRTQTDIADNMNTQLTGNEAGLVAYYRFDSPDAGVTFDMDIAEDDTLGLSVDYENVSGNADISLSWSKLNSFTVSYYNSTDLSGDAVWTTTEDKIDHDWGGLAVLTMKTLSPLIAFQHAGKGLLNLTKLPAAKTTVLSSPVMTARWNSMWMAT